MAWFDFSSGKNGSIFDFVMDDRGADVPGGGRGGWRRRPACRCRKVSHEEEARERAAQDALHDVDGAGGEILRGDARGAHRRQGARLSRRPQPRSGHAGRSSASAMRRRERFALKEHLGSQGVSVEDMVEAGLLVAGEDIPVPYDRFRDRVMFPITDLRGRVIAFGGRALEKDAQAKYLNSPETPLFHKGANALQHRDGARRPTHKGARRWSRSRAMST